MRDGIAAFSLPQDYLNVGGHVSANVRGVVRLGLWWANLKKQQRVKYRGDSEFP